MAVQKQVTTYYENFGGINKKASKYVTGIMEFLDLKNFDLETPGALTKRPGSSLYCGGNRASGFITGWHEYTQTSGASRIMVGMGTGLFEASGTSLIFNRAIAASANVPVDMLTYDDWMWLANGTTFLKFRGSTGLPFGLPKFPHEFWLTAGFSIIGQSSGLFQRSKYAFGYVNERGFIGPIDRTNVFAPATILRGGVSHILINGLTAPSGYGISYIAIFRNDEAYPLGIGTLYQEWPQPFFLLALLPAGTTTFTDTKGNVPLGDIETTADLTFTFTDFYPKGSSTAQPFIPKFLEIHQNSMFMAGMTQAQSQLWFSEIGDPETVQPDYNFPVRTDDGDWIRGMKSFGNELLVGKLGSLHKVVGDNPDNYELSEITTEFGFINNRTQVSNGDVLYFLDQKGVGEYRGTHPRIISDRMAPLFRRMNIQAATQQASVAHYDDRSQIWFTFPVDGASLNNACVVYDYKADAWFEHSLASVGGSGAPAMLLKAKGNYGRNTLFYGGYSGQIGFMSPSFFGDAGQGITCMAQSRFIQPQGRHAEAEFRRLWMDVDPVNPAVTGITGTIDVTFLSNMNSTSGITTMRVYQTDFQSRLEFGVQAKALSLIFSHSSASLPCTINGWAVAHKFLRDL